MMKYFQRDEDNRVVGVSNYPSPGAEETDQNPDIGDTFDEQAGTFSPLALPYVELVAERRASASPETWEEVGPADAFLVGDRARITATVRNPDGTRMEAFSPQNPIRVPIFAGIQGSPNPDGTLSITPTERQVASLPMVFSEGVATLEFDVPGTEPLCAVPGWSSGWLQEAFSRAVDVPPAT